MVFRSLEVTKLLQSILLEDAILDCQLVYSNTYSKLEGNAEM